MNLKQNFDKSAKAWSRKTGLSMALYVSLIFFIMGFVLGVAGGTINEAVCALTLSKWGELFNLITLIFAIPVAVGIVIGQQVPESIGYNIAEIMINMLIPFGLVLCYGSILIIKEGRKTKNENI